MTHPALRCTCVPTTIIEGAGKPDLLRHASHCALTLAANGGTVHPGALYETVGVVTVKPHKMDCPTCGDEFEFVPPENGYPVMCAVCSALLSNPSNAHAVSRDDGDGAISIRMPGGQRLGLTSQSAYQLAAHLVVAVAQGLNPNSPGDLNDKYDETRDYENGIRRFRHLVLEVAGRDDRAGVSTPVRITPPGGSLAGGSSVDLPTVRNAD